MSSYVDATAGAQEHCESMSALHADLADKYQYMTTLIQRKLWHQLTVSILEFVTAPKYNTLRTTAEGGNSYLALYDRVVLPVDKRLNPLTLARIASAVSTSLLDSEEGDGVAARAVLENLLEKRARLGPAPALYLESKLALLGLKLMERGSVAPTDSAAGETKSEEKTANMIDPVKHLESTKEMLKKNAVTLAELSDSGSGGDGMGGAESDAAVVHAAHYECSMIYRKAVGPPEAFYREAIQFLNYANLASMTREERVELAKDLSLAALTGEGVYNFGEVAQNPILDALKGTRNVFLLDMMRLAELGDVSAFLFVMDTCKAEIEALPALANRKTVLHEKVSLLAIVNMIFERPSSERTLKFTDISSQIGVKLINVEWVIMRALSLGLIRGSIDQVDQTVEITWVMPRVLDDQRLAILAAAFGEWAVKVSKAKDYMGEQTPTFA